MSKATKKGGRSYPNKKKPKEPSNQPLNAYQLLPDDLKISLPNPYYEHHRLKLPMMMLIVGSTGSGKTSTLFDMLNRFQDTFDKLILCLKSAEEPLYQNLLRKADPDTIELYENGEIPDIESYREFSSKGKQGLVVFDDLVGLNEKESKPICEYYKRGRKYGLSCVYLTQSYFGTPKFIRSQLTHLILKRVKGKHDLSQLLSECALETDLDDILYKYKRATANPLDFLTIDLATPDTDWRFRHNFLQPI